MVEFQEIRPYKIPPVFWRPKPKPDTPDLIMSLPPELRNRIYLEILPADQYYGTAPYCTRTKLPLLRLSKQIRAETACIFYGNNCFGIQCHLDSEEFATGIQKCRSIVRTCGPRPFLELRFSDLGPNTKILPQIAKLLPLLELMRDLKFEPDKDFVPGDHTKRRIRLAASPVGNRSFNMSCILRSTMPLEEPSHWAGVPGMRDGPRHNLSSGLRSSSSLP